MRAFGRHVEHDPQSRAYAAPEPVAGQAYRSVVWPRYSPILNQGVLGSCTGNAMAGWLGCAPHCRATQEASRFDERFAVSLYSKATQVDGIDGQYPPTDTGSSGLGVAKAARMLGEISGYGWCFTTKSLIHALQSGPVIAGIPWFERMSNPDASGEVHIGGAVEGGHEILIRGYNADRLVCDNSWGEGWGHDGSFAMGLAVWEYLRRQQADVTVPHL